MPLHKLTAEFIINTPLFMSGADQEQAELRVSSIKGAIRFWWRTLMYSQFTGNTPEEKIAAMKAMEDKLFGSTRVQSKILFSLHDETVPPVRDLPEAKNKTASALGMRYLGYGVLETDGTPNRDFIKNGKFTLRLLSKEPIEESIINAIKIFGLIGGLGSRSRKGYGSITLESLKGKECWAAPPDYENYTKEIKELLNKSQDCKSMPEITSFYKETEVFYLGENTKATEILGCYGLMMMHYRSAGVAGVVNDYSHDGPPVKVFDSENRFKDDHDWYRVDGWRAKHPDFHPERIVFGLPHNYHKKEIHHVESAAYERRASPLFFHIHKLGDNKYAAIAVIMKSVFLPDNDGKEIMAGNTSVPLAIDATYSKLSDFLLEKKDKYRSNEYAPYFPVNEKQPKLIYPQGDKT